MHMGSANIVGVVACGGQSSRMGKDKSLLVYHNKPQRYYFFDMLSQLCDDVYLSINANQVNSVEKDYRFITDMPEFQHAGPMTGLLSAFARCPGKDILYIGCDYPFLDLPELKGFMNFITAGKPAAFYNEATDTYEPLLAWYPHSHAETLAKRFQNNEHSLHHFLFDTGAMRYHPNNKRSLFSADTPEAFEQAMHMLK